MKHVMDVRVGNNGRMVLPKSVREALGVVDGGGVVLSVEGDVVKLTSMAQSIRRAQALYRQHASTKVSVEDFLKERRAEAAGEEQT